MPPDDATPIPDMAGEPAKLGQHPRSIARRFKPGHDGRMAIPGLKELRRKIRSEAEPILDQMLDIVFELPEWIPDSEGRMHMTGPSHGERIKAATLLLGYGFGPPTQKVEITGEGGGPIQHIGTLAVVQRIDRLTTGSMRRHLAELEERRARLLATAPERPAGVVDVEVVPVPDPVVR